MLEYKALEDKLREDLRDVGILNDYNLILKKYSKSFRGRYFPKTNTIALYVFEDKEGTKCKPYKTILAVLIHEAIHVIQFSDPTFVRQYGVMHDFQFKVLLDKYLSIARKKELI